MARSLADQIGRVVGGRYRLLALVGRGASADVYLADDVTLRRRVAVKVLHPALADDPGFLRRFRAEARTVASLRHPNIMAVFDWGEEPDGPFLVLEHLGGGSLRDIFDAGHLLTPSQALNVGLEAARALDYAHRRGLVHRDIKPANLLFDDEGRLCVADFGIARALAEAAWTEPTGAVMGTVRYASPEQARGATVDGRADVYALVLVLIEAVTGSVPFVADTAIATLMARTERPIDPPAWLGPLAPVLSAAGAIDPAARPDAAAFGRALDRAAGGLPPPAPLPLAGTPVELGNTSVDPTVLPPAATAVPGTPVPGTAVPGTPVAGTPVAGTPVAGTPPPSRPLRARRSRWSWYAAAALLVAVLTTAAVALPRLTAARYTVPDLRGRTLAEAAALIAPHHWHLAVSHTRLDGSVAGQIVRQSPGPSSSRRDGATISVEVSDGNTLVTVPDVRGEPQDKATAALTAAGFVIGQVDAPTRPDIPKGQVIDFSPTGAQPKGTAIHLVVSGGIIVPDVRGEDPSDAVNKLQAAGFTRVTQTEDFNDAVPSGEVIATDPPAGEAVDASTPVTVHVSKGPQIVVVPDVTGMRVDQATAALNQAGLVVGTIFGPPKARRVIATNPPPGSHVPHGSAVDLYASRD